MASRVLAAGASGACVLILWAFVANVFFGLRGRVEMNRVANEPLVYEALKANIAEPGGYMVNPPLDPSGAFPPNQPVFGVRYGGVGHESAGRTLWIELVIAFLAATIAAGLLSAASRRVLATYARRVLFLVAIGLLFALFRDLATFGIGGLPLRSSLLLAANDLISWTLVGSVVALWIRPHGDASV